MHDSQFAKILKNIHFCNSGPNHLTQVPSSAVGFSSFLPPCSQAVPKGCGVNHSDTHALLKMVLEDAVLMKGKTVGRSGGKGGGGGGEREGGFKWKVVLGT